MLKNIFERDHAEITPQILWSIGLKSNKTPSSSLYFHIKMYIHWKYWYMQYKIFLSTKAKIRKKQKRIRFFKFSHTMRFVGYRLGDVWVYKQEKD